MALKSRKSPGCEIAQSDLHRSTSRGGKKQLVMIAYDMEDETESSVVDSEMQTLRKELQSFFGEM